MSKIDIREGQIEDLPQVLELVKELAEYEKAAHEVENTVAQMEIDGFGANPIFGFFVAERSGKIVGISLYYYRYSTWKGKVLYLEDIIVTEKMRGQNIGYQLFEKTIQYAKDTGCKRMTWQVLEWNEPALNFYRKFGAQFDPEWVNGILTFS